MSESAPVPIIDQDGNINKEAALVQLGLGATELEKDVTFGSRTGKVKNMIVACPFVVDALREAMENGGLDGVSTALKGFSMVDRKFQLEISPETREAVTRRQAQGQGEKKSNWGQL